MLDFLKKHESEPKPRQRQFIYPAKVRIPFNTNDYNLRDSYRYTPHDEIDAGIIERNGITTGDMHFHKFMAGVGNNFISALYSVPAARKFYGDDFLHGVRCVTTSNPIKVVLMNMDDTLPAFLFTKEVVKYCAVVLAQWLKKYDYYLRWDHQTFYAVKPPIDHRFSVDEEYRIVWYDEPKRWSRN